MDILNVKENQRIVVCKFDSPWTYLDCVVLSVHQDMNPEKNQYAPKYCQKQQNPMEFAHHHPDSRAHVEKE